MLKRVALVLGVGLLLLVGVLLTRAMTFRSKQLNIKEVPISLNAKEVAGRLAKSVQFKTISHQDPNKFDGKPFLALHAFLEKAFPTVHQKLTRKVIGKYSLLYTWKGSKPSLKPVILMGHMDVVPVQPGTEKEWKHPPYSGKMTKTAVWGRGTLDDKVAVLGVLEAAEHLLKKGFQPARTLYFAFGHDEEVGGRYGAMQIASYLAKKNVKAEYVLDEGLAVTQGIMPGFKQPLALIGIAEKGYLTARIVARADGGHSSMPPKQTAAGILSQAIVRLEANPMPAAVKGVTASLFSYVGPEMGFGNRLVVANLWLFGGVLRGMLERKASTNATLRTTTAVTILRAGVKDNVLPIKAEAMVNFRILPGDTIESVLAHMRRVINDKRVTVSKDKAGLNKNPSPISSPSSPGFAMVHRSVRQVFHNSIVTPGLVLGGTDSRHFVGVTKNIYRFLPIEVTSSDLKRIHGTGERITISNYAKSVKFYMQVMRNAK